MAQEFVSATTDAPLSPISSQTQPPAPSNRERLKHILIGSPKVVKSTIHNLHVRGYAEVTAWSPLNCSDRNPCYFHSAATRILINGSKSVGTR